LPKGAARAKKIAEIYRGRWTIETSFQELEKWFNSEINALGYPPAALFGFCVSLVSYMMISVIKAALLRLKIVDFRSPRLAGLEKSCEKFNFRLAA
jgi:IS4 transposase